MRTIRGSKMLMILAAGGVLLRLLTRGGAPQTPVERKHMTGKHAGGAPKSDGWASDAAPPAVPKSVVLDEGGGLATGNSAHVSSGVAPDPASGGGGHADEATSDGARQLAGLSRPELYRLARSRGLPHTVMMTKADLVEALARSDE
jgi:hypothetical protein